MMQEEARQQCCIFQGSSPILVLVWLAGVNSAKMDTLTTEGSDKWATVFKVR
jgi:hypothetical protein